MRPARRGGGRFGPWWVAAAVVEADIYLAERRDRTGGLMATWGILPATATTNPSGKANLE